MSVRGGRNFALGRRGDRAGAAAGTGRGAAGRSGSAAAGSEAPEQPRGGESGQGGAAGTREGVRRWGWMSGFFWQRVAGKLAGAGPRLQRAPLSPSLSRALKIHPETKTSMCVCVTICLLSSAAATPASLASLLGAGNE